MLDINKPHSLIPSAWCLPSLVIVLALQVLPAEGYALLDIRQDEKARMLHYLDTLNLFAYVSILIVIVCTIWLFKHKRVKFIHETGLAIGYGLIVGAIIRYAGSETEITELGVVAKNASEVNATRVHVMPPDMLWIELNVSLLPQEVLNTLNLSQPQSLPPTVIASNGKNPIYETRSYAYVFQGELNAKPQNTKILEKATFDPEIFFNLILPVIVFNAGYSLKRKFFFRNFGAIMTYAFIGTTISCIVVGLVMKLLAVMMPATLAQFTLTDCLYFGAIISATDPVTVLAIFNDLKVDVTLHALVFGESILNDVISIVLASSIDSFSKHYDAGAFSAMYWALVDFMSIFVLSLLQGSAIGCFTALLTKFTKLCDHPMLESTLFVLMSYASFLIAEALELSGIVVVVCLLNILFTSKFSIFFRHRLGPVLWHLSGTLHLQQPKLAVACAHQVSVRDVQLHRREFHLRLHRRVDLHLPSAPVVVLVYRLHLYRHRPWPGAEHLPAELLPQPGPPQQDSD